MISTDANIKITRTDGKITSVSVLMPIWHKESGQGNLIVKLPFLGIETIAKNEEDAEKAIDEAISSFCIVSEKFGQGIEKELQTLGWVSVEDGSDSPLLGYNLEDTDVLLQRIIQTGENYVNPKLQLELA